MHDTPWFLRVAPLLLVWAATACDQPFGPPHDPPAALSSSPGPVLVECPTTESRSASGRVTGQGGTVELGDHRVEVPVGAVLAPVTLTIMEPVSRFMEVSIRAEGHESFRFRAPVTVTLGYSRCTRSNIDKSDRQVWHIDEATKALIENMGGVDDKLGRTVRFQTPHLSGYAFAD